MLVHIGVDDTDSKKGMCTTYLGAILRDRLAGFSEVLELRLVRLNPNIPWKTRGNGAVALRLETNNFSKARETALETVEEYSSLDEDGTDPGVVIKDGNLDSKLKSFYYKALHDVVRLDEAEKLAQQYGCRVHKFGSGRGIIGALAAIGADLSRHTYELIAYRERENWGEPRMVDQGSVFVMDKKTFPDTFNNVDMETSRILITPRSPCPVLFGIRGRNTAVLELARSIVKANEPVERTAIFKTNQGTDAHLRECRISEIRPYTSSIVKGSVVKDPWIIKGGHVFFTLGENGYTLDCAAFEPTGSFRDVVKALITGDFLRVSGGIKEKEKPALNLEKLEVLKTGEEFEYKNPICPSCKKSMKSAGKDQGFRCKMCKTVSQEKIAVRIERELSEGLYGVPPRAMRHISMPVIKGISFYE